MKVYFRFRSAIAIVQCATVHECMTDLDGVEAAGHAAVLDFHVGRRVGKLALLVGARALVACIFAAHFQSEPSRVLYLARQNLWRDDLVDHGHNIMYAATGIMYSTVISKRPRWPLLHMLE